MMNLFVGGELYPDGPSLRIEASARGFSSALMAPDHSGEGRG